MFGRIVLALDPEPDAGRSWETGALGEERVAGWLDAISDQTLLSLHDRRVPGSKRNIDHLVVTASGVWVVDPKRYSGVVEQRDVGGWLRSDVRLFVKGRDRSKLVAGVRRQIADVQRAVAEVEVPPSAVRGALCFVDTEWRLLAKPFSMDGVLVTWPKALGKVLHGPGPFDADQRAAIQRQLAISFPPAA